MCLCVRGCWQYANVVLKQNAARFYKISAFVVSDAVVRIPLAIVDAVVFGTLIYWSVDARFPPLACIVCDPSQLTG